MTAWSTPHPRNPSRHDHLLTTATDLHDDKTVPAVCKKPHSSFLTLLASHSQVLHHRLTHAKRELSLCFTNVVSVLTLLFLLIFTLGAETALRESTTGVSDAAITSVPLFSLYESTFPLPSSVPTLEALQRPPLHPSPIQHHLHDHYVIPWRFVNMLTAAQQAALLELLATPVVNATIPYWKRRAVFTHVTACALPQCIRAVATAATYARITNRVALIFADSLPDGSPISNVFEMDVERAIFANSSILVTVPATHPGLVDVQNASLADWAEFSVVDAIVPSVIPLDPHSSRNSARSEQHDDGSTSYSDNTATQSKIGNSKTPATLDNLAALDMHVSLTLSEVVWSRYAPRSTQEAFLDANFIPTSRAAAYTISRASILGRYSSTRTILRADSKLHRMYRVPQMLLRGISPLSRKLLLLKLQTKSRRGVKHPRAIFIHAQYGLGNRLRALGSALAFARRTDRVLVLIWVPDQHLNCFYTDLFVSSDEFVIADKFDPGEEWPFAKNNASDSVMKNVKWYNFMPVNGVRVSSPSQLVQDQKGYHLYVSTCYVMQSSVTPYIIRTTSSFWNVLRTLTPQINVLRLVERFESYPMYRMIGIHIRGKSIKADISGVDKTIYTEESSRTTDYWRNLTQVETFIEEMRRQTPDQMFYVAADQKEVFSRLEREFPSRVFFTPRQCDSRERDCLPFALSDILLLAKCDSLRGSYWSSFSELSTRIGGARFLLAGVDFGKP